MTVRLIGLVMLPVTVMCVLAGSTVVSHRSLATRAAAVDDAVARLSELVELREALHQQEAAARFDVRFAEVGVSRALAITFLKFDWTSEVAPARTNATRAATSLGPRSPVSAATLRWLYAGIDKGVISPTEAAQRLGGFGRVTGDALARRLDELEVEAREAPLVAALESLRLASNMGDVTTPQVIDLSAIWYASGDSGPAARARLARVSADSADYDTAVARLRKLGVKSVVASVALIEADPQIQAFHLAVAASLRGTPFTAPGATLDRDKLVAALRGHLVLDQRLGSLLDTATTAVSDEARHLAAEERAGFVGWAVGGAALALASIAVALWLARSISKPLKDLARYAHQVNEGELDTELSDSRNHGPRETRVAFDVFNDLVANLQLLDAKANALAQCDFDDPVLTEHLPGRLGRSLESSVAVLSGSIVERDQLQTHLAHQATHDSLTGIFNRPAAITAIQAAMHRAARTGATTALLFADLNEFKAVNDSHGHEVGDEVLRQVATRVETSVRSGDFVARLGGDEFVVVAEEVDGVDGATDLARRIIDAISQPIDIGGLRLTIGAAIGIALTLDGPEDPLRLLARADAAMYRAKLHEQAGSGIELFDADLQRQMIEREDIEAALMAALDDPAGGGLRLHYQPILEAMSGMLVGAEALIRWDRPGYGPLRPDSFVPVAEATALIIDLDCWVLSEATRQLVAWSTVAELADVPVSVNISGRHLISQQLPGHIATVLDQTGVDPHRLIVEITETVLVTDLVAAATELDAVRALGVRVAIDDFGTGYTSLAHLQQLPIDIIKIDRSFTSQLNERRGSSLVRMVTDLGHAIDIKIVAEGVETGEEMTALQEMGADHLQGYLLSRPLEPAALSTWAHERAEAERAATERRAVVITAGRTL